MNPTGKILAIGCCAVIAANLTGEADAPHTELRAYEEMPRLTYEIPQSTATYTIMPFWFSYPELSGPQFRVIASTKVPAR
jgi:hypothetical protein